METLDVKSILISVASGLLAVLVIIAKQKLANYFEKFFKGELDPVVEALNISKLIRDTLAQLASDWDASRIFIVQFHNGGHFYTGTSMQKFSITFEQHKPGVYPLYRVFQNMPITTCLYMEDIVNDVYMIEDTEDVTDAISKTFYHEFGVKSAIGVPIYKDHLIIAAVVIHYTDKTVQFKSTDLDLLNAQCQNFHTLLAQQGSKLGK